MDEIRTGDSEMVHQLLSGVPLDRTSLVLDVGCGTVNNTLLFQKAASVKTIGLDLSYGMLMKAVEKGSDIIFIHSPAENLPFRKECFDFIYMTEVVHHLDDVERSLSEIYRVLRPECRMCIVTQSHKQIEQRMTTRFFPPTADIDKARYPRIDELQHMLLSIGFEDAHPKIYDYEPVNLGQEFLEIIEARGFSMLHKISDDCYETGLKSLKSALSYGENLLYSSQYTFLWARK